MKDFMVHQARTLSAINEISKLFSSSMDYTEVARRCLNSLSDILDLERENAELRAAAAQGSYSRQFAANSSRFGTR